MNNTANTVLITGAAGFLGRYISRYFFKQDWDVVGIDTTNPENSPMESLSAYHQIKLPDSNFNTVLKSKEIDLCVHCAGRASIRLSVEDPRDDFYSSTVVTFELLNALRLYAPECRIIYLSSAAVYGNPGELPINEVATKTLPLSPYGFHKLQGEQICAEFSSIYGLPTASARIFSAYGPGLRRQVIWDIFNKALTEKNIVLQGTGSESRDFIHAMDIAEAIGCIAKNAQMEGEIYNVANGVEVTISDLAKLILTNIPDHGTLEFDGKVPRGVPINWRSDISKIERLGFSPKINLEDGIKQLTKWVLVELGKA